jgi:hypothetical protein
MRKILIVSLILIASGNVYSEKKLSTSEVNKINTLNQYVYDSVIKQNFIKLNKVTRKGNLDSCELEFQNAYRDNRGLKDGVMRTVVSVGSFSVFYNSEKHVLGASLKVIPAVIDIKTQEWEKLYPPYLDIFINEEGLEKYKLAEHQCENGGKCSVYGDKKGGVDLLTTISKELPFDGEIKLSLIKDGMDTGFKLSSLTTKEIWAKESEKFSKCNLELVEVLMTGLDKLSLEEKKTTK